MKKKTTCLRVMWVVLLVWLAAAGCSDDNDRGGAGASLNIIEPAAMQTLNTSNVWIAISFSFSNDADRKTFYAWLNEKPVGTLFHYTDDDIAKGLVSPGDGLNAGVDGPRENVFTAQVTGQNGAVYVQTIKFFVDCSGNSTPVARASCENGNDVFPGETVIFDGSGSEDADGDPLAYRWSIVSAPSGSKAELSDPSSIKPEFVPDVPGEYVAELIVDDYKAKSAPDTVKIYADELKILAYGELKSPIFDALKHYATVEQYGGFQLPRDYQIVALDGENHTPEELFDNGLVKKALADETWVLALNLAGEHKQEALIRHLGLVDGGESIAFMFKRMTGSGSPFIRIMNLPLLNVPDDEATDTELDGPLYAGIILKTLHPQQVMAPPPDNPIPDGLINARWEFSVPVTWTRTWSGRHDTSDGRVQKGIHTVNYTFTLFLDNKDNWQGNKQYLLLQIDAQGNPVAAGSSFMATDKDMSKHNEFGWFQDRFTVEVTPQDSFWIWLSNDPTSPNPVHQYTSSSSFEMQFNPAQGITGVYNYSNSESYSVTDWGISCYSSGNYMSWDMRTQKPQYDKRNDWFYTWCDKPITPNEMCLYQAQYHASAAWRTDNLKNQTSVFAVKGLQHITNTHCPSDWGTTCCGKPGQMLGGSSSYNQTFSLNLGEIIPIEVAAITFDQYPVLVGPLGKTIKGTVILKEPAKRDTQIVCIKSDNTHAAPKSDRMLINKDKLTGTFEIDVNAGGVPVNETLFAAISAFYAKGYSQQLAMKAVDTLTCPLTAPSWSPNFDDWGGMTAPPNWVDDYMVRYAVSFVYPGDVESPMGPWSDWIGPGYELGHHAMPLLTGIPTDSSNTAVARKIYRQFFANYQSADPSQGVEFVATLNDNTTKTYLDDKP